MVLLRKVKLAPWKYLRTQRLKAMREGRLTTVLYHEKKPCHSCHGDSWCYENYFSTSVTL